MLWTIDLAWLVNDDDHTITIQQHTNYPFEDHVRFDITASQATPVKLSLRIPQWCNEARIDGAVIEADEQGWFVWHQVVEDGYGFTLN